MSHRIVHLSDLHFGRARADLVEPLLETVNGLAPDLVAISGDLTQRARRWQFREARRFIDRLEPPVLVVPGNHDVPLDNPLVRLLTPWRRYRRQITETLEPEWRDGWLLVIGLNTVNPFVWQSGRLGAGALARAARRMDREGVAVRIVVAHHPMELPPGADKTPTRGADRAIDALSAAGTDIVLTGHLHHWRAEPFAERAGRRRAISVHAGTSLSTRLRGEENDFNLLTLRDRTVSVERYVAGPEDTRFERVTQKRFQLSGAR